MIYKEILKRNYNDTKILKTNKLINKIYNNNKLNT